MTRRVLVMLTTITLFSVAAVRAEWKMVVHHDDTADEYSVSAVDSVTFYDAGIYVSPGTFTMGSPAGEPGRVEDENQHQVTLTHGLYVQSTEVTNRQYMKAAQWAYDHGYATVSGTYLRDNMDGSTEVLTRLNGEITFSNGVFDCTNPDHPVTRVTWFGAVAYCDWLSLQHGSSPAYNHGTWQCNGGNPYAASGYRLPTEAEWEYACRASSATAFANGVITSPDGCNVPGDPLLNEIGWYCVNSASETNAVAQKIANGWGLYDMHGNAWEWCNDWYGAYGDAATDPVGAGTGELRVRRGGSWVDPARGCRSACRWIGDYPNNWNSNIGIRPVRSAS